MKPWSGPKFSENAKRCKGEQYPCALCGKPIKDRKTAVMVFICCDDFQPWHAEEAHREHRNNMGGYPLGPDCAARLKRARPEILGGRAHPVSCECCRAKKICHACFKPVTSETRCTSGACLVCCGAAHLHPGGKI